MVLWNQSSTLTVSDIFNGKCDAVFHVTSNDLYTKVIHFGTNRFLIYNLLLAVSSNVCSRTHRLATIHNVTDDGDRRRTSDH